MVVEKLTIYGTSFVGTFIYTSEYFTLAPDDLPMKTYNILESTLKVPLIKCSIYGSCLLGIFAVGNSNGLILPSYALDEEVDFLKKSILDQTGRDIIVERLNSLNTAVGNLILTNDKAAIISKELKDCRREIEDILDVEVELRDVAGNSLVGAVAIATNRGLLVHPLASDEEVEELGKFMGVQADVGTVNKGSPYLRAGIVANSRGAVVGIDTTGPELMKIQQILFS